MAWDSSCGGEETPRRLDRGSWSLKSSRKMEEIRNFGSHLGKMLADTTQGEVMWVFVSLWETPSFLRKWHIGSEGAVSLSSLETWVFHMEHHPFWKISLAEQVFSLTLETLEGCDTRRPVSFLFSAALSLLSCAVPIFVLSLPRGGSSCRRIHIQTWTQRDGISKAWAGRRISAVTFGLISTQAYRAPSSVPL